VAVWGARVFAYGPDGHEIVGAVADAKLAGTPTAQKVGQLLDGLTLAEAATIPDQIKSWDKHGPDDHRGFHRPEHQALEDQLKAFWKANPPPATPPTDQDAALTPSHHWFHYTDVPLVDAEKYGDGSVGRTRWDIVHMINYCVRVLEGKESETNARAITKPVAIILLAHYAGDIHQPLHVGAEYFDKTGHPVNPDKTPGALEDQGGNSLFLVLNGPTTDGQVHPKLTLHGYWDNHAVVSAQARIKAEILKADPTRTSDIERPDIVKFLAATEPANWQLDGSPEDAGRLWADDILPLAREAHDRLEFQNVEEKDDHDMVLAAGFAKEKAMPDGIAYNDWAGGIVELELAKAGWRLADLLQKALQ